MDKAKLFVGAFANVESAKKCRDIAQLMLLGSTMEACAKINLNNPRHHYLTAVGQVKWCAEAMSACLILQGHFLATQDSDRAHTISNMIQLNNSTNIDNPDTGVMMAAALTSALEADPMSCVRPPVCAQELLMQELHANGVLAPHQTLKDVPGETGCIIIMFLLMGTVRFIA